MAYPVSSRYVAALAGSQMRLVGAATITSAGRPVLGPIPIDQATITCSRSQAQRMTVSAVFAGSAAAGIVPTGMTSPLAPNGNELVITAGVRYADGTSETMPVGVFPIQTVTVDDTGTDLTVTVTAADRSWSIGRRALLSPYTIASGTSLDQALRALLSANTTGMPPFTYAIAPTGAEAPVNTYNEGQDPWQAALDLAAGFGSECFFDRHGNLQSRPIPQPGSISPTWAAAEATGGSPLGLTRTLTAQQVANDFIVFSSAATVQPSVRSEAADTNPLSPTSVDGPFGDIPMFLSSSTIADSVGAAAAATGQLTASLGQVDTMVLTAVPNPAVDVDDVYTITRARAGVLGTTWVVDGWTLPLGGGRPMTVNVRRVTA